MHSLIANLLCRNSAAMGSWGLLLMTAMASTCIGSVAVQTVQHQSDQHQGGQHVRVITAKHDGSHGGN